MIFVTSDTHFFHTNIIGFCSRPYANVVEMNEDLIANWNSVVGPNDEVYHLGDVGFSDPKRTAQILKRLNGKKYLIIGNHDHRNLKGYEFFKQFAWVKDYYTFFYNKKLFVLFHYPIKSWDRKNHKSIHLYGHQHSKNNDDGLSMDVGVDNPLCSYKPISIDQVITIMAAKKFNHGVKDIPDTMSTWQKIKRWLQ